MEIFDLLRCFEIFTMFSSGRPGEPVSSYLTRIHHSTVLTDIVICTWAPSSPGHQGHYGAMSGGDTAIPGIRVDICMSDLMLSDICEVSGTLCAKTLNLFFLVPLTDTNPLETINIFFSSSFHYFLSYFLSPVSSTIIFFFPNHTQEEKTSKNRNKNPLSPCSQHRFDPWSGKNPHTM